MYAVGRAMREVERCRGFGAIKLKSHSETGESRLQRDGEMKVVLEDELACGCSQVAGRRSDC